MPSYTVEFRDTVVAELEVDADNPSEASRIAEDLLKDKAMRADLGYVIDNRFDVSSRQWELFQVLENNSVEQTDDAVQSSVVCLKCDEPAIVKITPLLEGEPEPSWNSCEVHLLEQIEIWKEEPVAADQTPGTDLGRAYLDRVTRDRELTSEDQDLLRGLLGRD